MKIDCEQLRGAIMSSVTTTLNIPDEIQQGLINGTLERVGGVVRKVDSKQVVAWLREIYENNNNNELSNISNLLFANTAIGSLNLAVSSMSFVVVLKRLNNIIQKLEQTNQQLNTIDYKIDLSFYSNFRAAIDLAQNAFTMTNIEVSKMSALQAINRFLEAEHYYSKLIDMEMDNGCLVANEYLSSLCLAYVTEVRCYLELEELDTARRRLKEGISAIRPRYERFINILLTSNPASYLHPNLKGHIDLNRLTRIYQWIDPGIKPSDVFEIQRKNIFDFELNQKEWNSSLPNIINFVKPGDNSNSVFNDLAKQSKKFIGALPNISIFTNKKTPAIEPAVQSSEIKIYERLPAMMGMMESLVEDDKRLETYESEIEFITKSGMNFKEWRLLSSPENSSTNDSNILYLMAS
jgi:tetratricopeptide (TPR) repeat protein